MKASVGLNQNAPTVPSSLVQEIYIVSPCLDLIKGIQHKSIANAATSPLTRENLPDLLCPTMKGILPYMPLVHQDRTRRRPSCKADMVEYPPGVLPIVDFSAIFVMCSGIP